MLHELSPLMSRHAAPQMEEKGPLPEQKLVGALPEPEPPLPEPPEPPEPPEGGGLVGASGGMGRSGGMGGSGLFCWMGLKMRPGTRAF